jgi:hypothetical protein
MDPQPAPPPRAPLTAPTPTYESKCVYSRTFVAPFFAQQRGPKCEEGRIILFEKLFDEFEHIWMLLEVSKLFPRKDWFKMNEHWRPDLHPKKTFVGRKFFHREQVGIAF